MNSFMKRRYGKKLLNVTLPQYDSAEEVWTSEKLSGALEIFETIFDSDITASSFFSAMDLKNMCIDMYYVFGSFRRFKTSSGRIRTRIEWNITNPFMLGLACVWFVKQEKR